MKTYPITNCLIILIALFFSGCRNSETNEMQKEVEKVVSEWIKLNADFPETYTPISFESFDDVSAVYNVISYYKIIHSYKLNSSNNVPYNNTHEFVLTRDLKIAIISFDKTKYIRGVPPSVFDWAMTFGERFAQVDFNDLDSTYFYAKYKDYKNLGGNAKQGFNHWGKDCVSFLLKSLKDYTNGEMKINRIITRSPKSNIDEKLNKSDFRKLHLNDKNPKTNYAVLQKPDKETESYATMHYIESTNRIHFKELGSDLEFSFELDSSYISTNCFESSF